MKFHRLGVCVCLVTFAFTSCNGTSLDLNQRNVNASPSATNSNSSINQNKADTKSEKTLYYLDLDKPQVEQPISPEDTAVERAKFVEVEVSEVTNPQNYPVRFEVRYQPKDQEQILLGSFSLYPSNNPGTFIVATQGKVRSEGKIILTLVTSEKAKPGDLLKVGVKRIRLRKE